MIKWDELNLKLIGEAEDGYKALEAIKSSKPDIVITDIRMPGCDGLQLLMTIQENYPFIQSIVISGYDDFKYAQKAMKYGSIEYILKPISPEELNNSIKKACNIINKKRKTINTDSTDKRISEFLYKVVHDLKNDDELIFDGFCDINVNTGIFCIGTIRSQLRDNDFDGLYHKVMGSRNFIKVLRIENENQFILVFCGRPETDLKLFENMAFNALDDAVSSSFPHKGMITVGLGQPCIGIGSIRTSYISALEALSYCLLIKESVILRYSQVMDRKAKKIDVFKYENELLLYISAGNIQGLKSLFNIIINEIFEKQEISLDSIKLTFSYLYNIILKVDTELHDVIKYNLEKLNNREKFLSCFSIERMKKDLFDLYLCAAEKFAYKKHEKSATVVRIKEFIDKNYHTDIGQDEIAKRFFINASYLSKLFKQETGENFNEYITKVRVENAKKMISSDNLRISDVAQAVGYSNLEYFYKVFKKSTGMTPKEFQTVSAKTKIRQ
jgi:two-component system, response regulator YesN